MNTKTAKTRILAGEFDAALSRLYGDARVPAQRIRYANAAYRAFGFAELRELVAVF